MNAIARRLATYAAISLTIMFAGNPPTPTMHAPTTAERCAVELGIHYTAEDGATEELDAFQACMAR